MIDIAGSGSFSNSFDTLPAFVFVERQGRIVYANLAARRALGQNLGDPLDKPVEEIFWGTPPHSVQTHSSSTPQGFESRILGAEDRLIPVRGVRNLADPENSETIIIAVPSAHQQETPRSNFLEDVLSSAPEAVAITRGSRVLHINKEFTRLFGYLPDDAVGMDIDELILPDECRQEKEQLYAAADLEGRASIETKRKTRHGDLIDVALLVSPVVVKGEHVGYYASYRDARDRKKYEAKLQHQAMHDNLTGLANRTLLLERIQAVLGKQAGKENSVRKPAFAVMYLDLDKFKEVNDTLGHAIGDEVLKTVAQRLRSCFRPNDTLARLGGDEFAVLLENIHNPADVRRIASRLGREIAQPMPISTHVLELHTSIGIVFGSSSHETPAQILQDADYAMYRAKERGGCGYEVFDDFMQIDVTVQQQKERELRHAIENRLFEVWYQPVYFLSDGCVEGFEALLRWRRPDGVCVSFLDLLPVAEETGLMIPIGREVMEKACLQLGSWKKRYSRQLTMSVNISARQFVQPDLVDRIKFLLEYAEIPASSLRLEIPEIALNQHPEGAITVMQQLSDWGIQLALDNFGSELGAFNHLLELPINVVKLDRRLISRLTFSGKHSAFLESLFNVGRTLNVRMLAEGVETMEQFEVLRSYGCEMAQGHLFSKPVSTEHASALLEYGSWPSEFMA